MNDFIVNKEDQLSTLIKNKRVLHIPIVSMRSHIDNVYDLGCDGNVNRFLSKFHNIDIESLTITLPTLCKNKELITKILPNATLIECPCYGSNANFTRKNLKWFEWLETHLKTNEYDVVLFEPNIIVDFDFPKNIHPIYWLPVSQTRKVEPKFIKEFQIIDLDGVEHFTTIVSSQGQKDFFNHHNVMLDNNVIDVELFESLENKTKIIFHPFRQSDDGYKTKEIYQVLEELHNEGVKFKLFYTAPNEVVVPTKFPAYKVATDRWLYYTILKQKPIIVYLEDPTEILHTSIFEFIHYDSKLIYYANGMFRHKDGVGEITSFDQLKSKLLVFLT